MPLASVCIRYTFTSLIFGMLFDLLKGDPIRCKKFQIELKQSFFENYSIAFAPQCVGKFGRNMSGVTNFWGKFCPSIL